MTVVVARKLGEYILIASDTEITEKGGTKRNIIPGALKTIVIDLNCTIALSGNYTRGLDLIRDLRRTFLRTRDFDQILELLRRDTESGECDYIIAMHRPQAELRKVWRGQVSDPIDVAWLGNSEVADMLFALEPTALSENIQARVQPGQFEFYAYHGALQSFAIQHGISMGDGVGGALILQMGSPHGHTYSGWAAVKSWNIPLNPSMEAENDRARATGEQSFGYSVYAPNERGIPLLSVYFDQAQAGAIYSPLVEDEPTLVASSLPDLSARVNELAKTLGGIATDHWTVPGQDFDAIAVRTLADAD